MVYRWYVLKQHARETIYICCNVERYGERLAKLDAVSDTDIRPPKKDLDPHQFLSLS